MREMALARLRRPVQHQRAGRPAGPALDPAERVGIADGDEKIGAPECWRLLRQIDRELRHLKRVTLAGGSGSERVAS
jgi:hypothetical protein